MIACIQAPDVHRVRYLRGSASPTMEISDRYAARRPSRRTTSNVLTSTQSFPATAPLVAEVGDPAGSGSQPGPMITIRPHCTATRVTVSPPTVGVRSATARVPSREKKPARASVPLATSHNRVRRTRRVVTGRSTATDPSRDNQMGHDSPRTCRLPTTAGLGANLGLVVPGNMTWQDRIARFRTCDVNPPDNSISNGRRQRPRHARIEMGGFSRCSEIRDHPSPVYWRSGAGTQRPEFPRSRAYCPLATSPGTDQNPAETAAPHVLRAIAEIRQKTQGRASGILLAENTLPGVRFSPRTGVGSTHAEMP